MRENNQTGYLSIDKPWLKYYDSNAFQMANNIPKDKTIWDVLEEKLIQDKEIPAIEYFGCKISRTQFINLVYDWAKTFKVMGIREDEVVPIYGPFVPDVCAMTLALNVIGATGYFLKLAISPEALAEETKESRFAIVYKDMWQNVHMEFEKERFEKVIFSSVVDYMPFPTNAIVAVSSAFKSKNNSMSIPKDGKYLSLKEAIKMGTHYRGAIKAKFVPNRSAYITSSSGTTVGGVVKGTVATNESTITQLYMAAASEVQFFRGDTVLNNFPPTASTSLNVLFFLGLYRGMTVIIDPRVSEKDFYNQVMKHKPNIVLTTGSMWDAFFTKVDVELHSGKTYDFSCAKCWIIGGEGTTPRKLKKWNLIMNQCKGRNIFSGYGSSELFSAIGVDTIIADSNKKNDRPVLGVGIPYAGLTAGVFDNTGKELSYNQRGELWVKSKSAMKGYYNKPDLTAEVLVDGWIHTGDLAEISEDGFIYIYGRCKDSVLTLDGSKVYMFDIENEIKQDDKIGDAIVLTIPELHDATKLFAHIEWLDDTSEEEKAASLVSIDKHLKEFLPTGLSIEGYAEHKRLPYSPTTLKKDKNKLSKQKDGYFTV
jgi:acyl-CoA synthetase (AMP-forming)/AMP-acid ligase II